MKKRFRRIAAATLAVLMSATLIPTGMFANDNLSLGPIVANAAQSTSGIDFTQGLRTGTSYGKSLRLSVLTDMTYSVSAHTFDSGEYPGCATNSGNAAVGGDKIPTSNAIKLEPERDGDLIIDYKVNKNRVFYLVDQNGEVIGTGDNSKGTASAYFSQTYQLTAGTTYYMYVGGNKLFMYNITWNPQNEVTDIDLTNGLVKGEDHAGVKALTNMAYKAEQKTIDGVDCTGYVPDTKVSPAPTNPAMGDGVTVPANVPTDGTAIEFTPVEDGSIRLSFKNSKKVYFFVDDQGNEIDKIDDTSKTSSTFYTKTYSVKEGRKYYAYVKGSKIAFYGIQVTKGTRRDVVTWDKVEAPKIDAVTKDSDGNFKVDFTAVIDKDAGAEAVKISMMESGYEVATTTVKSQSVTSVTMQPLWSGNYTFVAVAQRTGEADKQSNIVKYDDYVMAVRKPVITWAQNKGNGSVYLDWVNIEDADSYAVGYRLADSADDYTMAETNLPASQGDYTLTGLTADKTYEVIVKAARKSDGFIASATKNVDVKAESDQQWYLATVGSAQATNATVTEANMAETTYSLASSDNVATKTNLTEAVSIANTDGSLFIKGQDTGKISDDEDGFSYYYTKIDPDTENFKLSATFKITDTSLTPDNQTGFGVVAADTLGINNWEKIDYVHKYFNSASSIMYSSKSKYPVLRTVTGYSSADSSNNDGAERTVTNRNFTDSSAEFVKDKTYELALEKTNSGYVATCDGKDIILDDNSFTSVQEDGTVCVGLMVSRKVSVMMSDVTFTKSASTGITVNDSKDEKITPNATVYSSETCAGSDYVYIYQPNCSGKLTVTGPKGAVITDEQVAASEVVRVNVPISVGSNTVSSTFVPDANSKLTSTAAVQKSTIVDCQRYGKEGETIIVSADGKADGQGTESSPLDIVTAVKYAQPGQTIFVKNGTYTDWVTIKRSVSGTADKPIKMVAETTGKVKFEGAGITVIGDYWNIYGMYVKDSTGVGIQVSGNYNTVEMCTVEHSANSGVQISRSGSADHAAGINYKLWPTGNLIKNCESFDNCDPGRNDADGFAAKLTCGTDNVFYGCISHNNIDDGWDLYAKSVTGEIGSVLIENCIAYNNGWLTTDDITAAGYNYGEGNGFKLGGGYLKGGHVLKNCITYNNHAKGITSNSCPDCKIINCISYMNSFKNSAYNVGLNTKDSNVKAWEVSGLMSINDRSNTTLEDLIPFSLHSEDNFIYDGTASYNNKGVMTTDDWFENVDMTVAPERNVNGTINMHSLLQLKSSAPANSGARLDVTSEKAVSVQPAKTTVVSGKAEAEKPDVKPDVKPDDKPDVKPDDKPDVPETPDKPEVKPDKPGTPDKPEVKPENPEVTPDKPVVTPNDNQPESDKDEEGSELPVQMPVEAAENVISSAKIDKKAVVKDATGNVVALDQVKIKAEPSSEAATKLNNAFTDSMIVVNAGVNMTFYDIKIVDANGNPLTLESGSVIVTFAIPEGVDYSKYDFTVYHLREDGTLEKLATSVSDKGISVETTGFSPYAVVYELKSDVATDTTPTGDKSNSMMYMIFAIAALTVLLGAGYEVVCKKHKKSHK